MPQAGKPPDLDAQGQPISETAPAGKPPDLDADGQPIEAPDRITAMARRLNMPAPKDFERSLMFAVPTPGAVTSVGKTAVGVAGRVAAGIKAVAPTVAALGKYEVAHMALRALNVPEVIAGPAAMLASGGRKPKAAAKPSPNAGGRLVPKSAPAPSIADELATELKPGAPKLQSVTLPPHVPTPATGTATRVYEAPRPVAAPPASRPVPSAPPAATAVKSAMSPAMIRNQVGLAAKRANAEFTAAQLDTADVLVGRGLTPVQAVMKIKEAGRSANAAAKLAEMLQGKGAMSVEQMNAEIAARVGNRSPVRTQ